MREVRSLVRLQAAFELLYVALLALCLMLPLPFIAATIPPIPTLAWCLGGAAGTALIQILFRRLEKPLPAILLSLLLTAGAVLLFPGFFLQLSCGLAMGLQLLICALLPKPNGTYVLSVPKVYHAPIPLVVYALSQILKSEVLTAAAVAIASLFVVLLLLHWQAGRLLRSIRDQGSTAVSDRSVVRLNRRLMVLFCVLGALFVILAPMLLRLPPKPVEPYGDFTFTPVTEAPLVPEESDDIAITPPSAHSYDLSFFGSFAFGLTVFLAAAAVGVLIFSVIWLLRSLQGGKQRHSDPRAEDEMVIEALDDPAKQRPLRRRAETDNSWARRIRRQYQRLIRQRAGKQARLSALTPRELEQAAALEGPDRDALHALYEKARYSQADCGKEDYQQAKLAAQRLKKGDRHDGRV